jgi:hypothetical protein
MPRKIGETVVEASPVVEVDEVSETPHDLIPETLDEFLRDIHQTSSLNTQNSDLPSLEFLKKHFKTRSAAIRYLHSKGHSVNVIHKHLNLRYQHVRNVLTTELKRGPNEQPTINDLDNTKNLERF